jgi:hypothetical protein
MVNSQKKVLGCLMGLLGNVNDSRALKKSKLYQCAIHGGLFDMAIGLQNGMSLYILGDKHYRPLSWFMTSHKENKKQHSMLELLYNRKH